VRSHFTATLAVFTLALALVFSTNAKAIGNALAVIACSSSTPCAGGNNAGSGPGVRGTSASGLGIQGHSTKDYGVLGTTAASNKAGVYGQGGTYGTGLYGSTQKGLGVEGTSSSSYGVEGNSTTSIGVYGTGGQRGVSGTSSSGVGVYGSSVNSTGIVAVSDYGNAFEAESYGSSEALRVIGGTGDALTAQGSGLGEYVSSTANNGADINGNYIGTVSRTPAGTSYYPIVATDSTGHNLFYVNGNGDVSYHGSLNTFVRMRNGSSARAFSPKSTSPTVEDTGSANLVNGMAVVALEPTFAQTIDPRRPYQVMLTPDGDTRGLFVARKDPRGFVVREVQGGRGSFAFDYHIYAAAVDAGSQRMAMMTASQEPHAPIVRHVFVRLPRP
jgi:hypothetical protein